MISWCSVPSPAYTSCNNNATVTSKQRCYDVWCDCDVIITQFIYCDIYIYFYIYTHNVLHVAPYTRNSNMPFCMNNNLNKSNLTFAHGKYIGLLAMIMLLHNTLLILCLLS